MRRTSLFLLAMGMLGISAGCSNRLNPSEKMMWSTYPLITKSAAATAFLIKRSGSSGDQGGESMLVTSAHALQAAGRGPFYLGLHLVDEDGNGGMAFLSLAGDEREGGKLFYVRHPRHDVAVVPVRLPSPWDEFAELPTALEESNLAHAGHDVQTGMEVGFLGYPSVLPGTDGGFPVLRSGRIASYPVGAKMSHGYFLINTDVYPGDSGAPVYLMGERGRPRLAGMIIQRIGKYPDTFSHLAIAVDADAIRETIALLDADGQTVAAARKASLSTRIQEKR